MKKRFYYQFWLQSSRGTDTSTVRLYTKRPTKEQLKTDVETWGEGFGAWHVSENAVSYGWKQITRLPKNRRECLTKHSAAWKQRDKWVKKTKLLAGLLALPPFNGQR